MEVKRLVRILGFLVAMMFVFSSCEKEDLDYSYLEQKWYLSDYPLYQSCDIGSWITLEADGVTHAQMLCSSSQSILEGTWSLDGDELIIENSRLAEAGLGTSGTIKSLSATEMKYETTILYEGVIFPVTVTFTSEIQE